MASRDGGRLTALWSSVGLAFANYQTHRWPTAALRQSVGLASVGSIWWRGSGKLFYPLPQTFRFFCQPAVNSTACVRNLRPDVLKPKPRLTQLPPRPQSGGRHCTKRLVRQITWGIFLQWLFLQKYPPGPNWVL